MAQEAKNVGSIFELVQGQKADTGEMLALHGVSVERRGSLDFVLTDGKSRVPCFCQKGVNFETAQNGSHEPKYDVTGTWHGEYFVAYEANKI